MRFYSRKDHPLFDYYYTLDLYIELPDNYPFFFNLRWLSFYLAQMLRRNWLHQVGPYICNWSYICTLYRNYTLIWWNPRVSFDTEKRELNRSDRRCKKFFWFNWWIFRFCKQIYCDREYFFVRVCLRQRSATFLNLVIYLRNRSIFLPCGCDLKGSRKVHSAFIFEEYDLISWKALIPFTRAKLVRWMTTLEALFQPALHHGSS